jgi:hypothetical protein
MKNFILLSSLILSSTTFAASLGELHLQGQVSKKVSISVTPEVIASGLNLELSQADLKVATVSEKSNSSSGYTVAISSLHGGRLVRTGGTESVSYTLKYGALPVDLAAGQSFDDSSAGPVTNSKNLAISYTGVDAVSMAVGDYLDTLALNIIAK